MAQYEYGMMVETGALRADFWDASSEQVSAGLAQSLGKIADKVGKALPKFQGGGWEVISHNLTRIKRHLIVTFMIRRTIET